MGSHLLSIHQTKPKINSAKKDCVAISNRTHSSGQKILKTAREITGHNNNGNVWYTVKPLIGTTLEEEERKQKEDRRRTKKKNTKNEEEEEKFQKLNSENDEY